MFINSGSQVAPSYVGILKSRIQRTVTGTGPGFTRGRKLNPLGVSLAVSALRLTSYPLTACHH